MKIKPKFMFQAKETFLRLIPLYIARISENSTLQKNTTLITRSTIIIVLKNDQNWQTNDQSQVLRTWSLINNL